MPSDFCAKECAFSREPPFLVAKNSLSLYVSKGGKDVTEFKTNVVNNIVNRRDMVKINDHH